MTTKLKSSELGCGAPYRLTYSGQVFASSEARSLLSDYICAYKASVERVVRYFSEVIRRGFKNAASLNSKTEIYTAKAHQPAEKGLNRPKRPRGKAFQL